MCFYIYFYIVIQLKMKLVHAVCEHFEPGEKILREDLINV